MQVFLCQNNVEKALECLDKKRLFKQILEISQILNTILQNKKGWRNHPAVLMIEHFESFGGFYGLTACKVAKDQGIKIDNILYSLEKTIKDYSLSASSPTYPDWFGDERLHSSHRSKLLYKGRVDAVCSGIKKELGLFSINAWLDEQNLPPKNVLLLDQTIALECFAIANKIDIPHNHYRQFGWDENDDNSVPYFWPVKKS